MRLDSWLGFDRPELKMVASSDVLGAGWDELGLWVYAWDV